MKETIFFIEDDAAINSLIKATLELNGYTARGFKDPRDFLAAIETEVPDMLILDLMLPVMSGYDVLDRLKKDERFADIPVIILSALAEELDVVKGLDYGAADYICKPFGVIDLMARVRSNLRKGRTASERRGILSVPGLVLDKNRFTCTVDGVRVRLAAKEFNLLKTLLENKNRVMTRAELLRIVWGFGEEIETRTLDMHVKTLREKLAKASPRKFVVTIHSVGYVIYDEQE